MKLIKVSFFLKTLTYLLSLFLLVNTILVPESYLHFEFLFSFVVIVLNVGLFYFVLKNKLIAIKLYWAYLAILSYVFLSLNSSFPIATAWETEGSYYIISVYLLFLVLIILNLYFLYKNIRKWVENIDLKKTTTRKQEKNFLLLIICTILILIIFRFGYYEREEDIQKVDDSFFVTRLQNTDVKSTDNLAIDLKNFTFEEENKTKILKSEIVDCYYNDICYEWLIYYENNIKNNTSKGSKKGAITNIEEQKIIQSYLKDHLDILYQFKDINMGSKVNNLLLNLSQKKYYKSDFNEWTVWSWFIQFNRELQYQILYYLSNHEEDKAIALLKAQIDTSLTMLNGDSTIVETLVAYTTLQMWLKNVDLIIRNFPLSENSKHILTQTLESNMDMVESIDNSLKSEYKFMLKNMPILPYKTTLYDKSYVEKCLREITFNNIVNKWEFTPEIISKYVEVPNIFKKDIIGKILLRGMISSSRTQYKKASELEKLRISILERLQKK